MKRECNQLLNAYTNYFYHSVFLSLGIVSGTRSTTDQHGKSKTQGWYKIANKMQAWETQFLHDKIVNHIVPNELFINKHTYLFVFTAEEIWFILIFFIGNITVPHVSHRHNVWSVSRENTSPFDPWLWRHFTDDEKTSDARNDSLHWHSFGEPRLHFVQGSFHSSFPHL